MAVISRLLNLPTELHDQINDLTHEQLLIAESADLATEKDIFTCLYCLRLRPGPRFSDTMLKAKKRRGCVEACKRFRVDCGICSGLGITRYQRGHRITVQGEPCVICNRCNRFRPAPSQDKAAKDFLSCWTSSRKLQEARKRAEERAKRVTERDQRRARRRELGYYSDETDYSDEDDDEDEPFFGTPGWEAHHIALVQSSCFGDCASDFY
ncbi:hypothetical protein EJ08DRAFT_483478 [Tothia fuscella]|uniref:Stc1 domain-containing protein n=1 Tax=Tothia fuscella TaxID=1048955 RepID=A0A9P4TUA1_9PEZI|nr:hypothetical protein EJ08DRAFT_483478 [Tothia fuscella]